MAQQQTQRQLIGWLLIITGIVLALGMVGNTALAWFHPMASSSALSLSAHGHVYAMHNTATQEQLQSLQEQQKQQESMFAAPQHTVGIGRDGNRQHGHRNLFPLLLIVPLLIAAGVGGALVWFFMRKRNRNTPNNPPGNGNHDDADEYKEIYASPQHHNDQPQEI